MLTLSNLSKRFGPKILFREVSLRMMRGEKMGLVGANGAGKTTLLSILLGELQEDEGMVEWERGTRIGYLPQESAPTGEETVLELATSVTPELARIMETLRESPDPEDPNRLEALERFAELDGFTLEAKAKKILSGLAFHFGGLRQARPHPERWLDHAGPLGPFVGHGTRPPDARRTD